MNPRDHAGTTRDPVSLTTVKSSTQSKLTSAATSYTAQSTCRQKLLVKKKSVQDQMLEEAQAQLQLQQNSGKNIEGADKSISNCSYSRDDLANSAISGRSHGDLTDNAFSSHSCGDIADRAIGVV